MEILKKLDALAFKAIRTFAGIAMVLLTAVIIIQILARYVFKVSIGGIEETPIFLMMISVWLSAIIVAREDGHVKIDLIDLMIKNKKILYILKTVLRCLTTVVLGIYAKFALDYLISSMRLGDTTPGLGIPVWMMHSFVFISAFFMTLYYLINSIKAIKEVWEWR
ncbi:TRAP transporter small permease [Geosporobacter ferrireducens]|uniref:TRAP transporter small permease n=1 Tax=Geosporobacter ferrireducens TaxID=1424294 RepID=UPI00235745D2|nr:TRAP transporter small permease subunit [Geosporobacter ferrireducens]